MQSTEAVLSLLEAAIADAGYAPGSQISLALDCAASEFYRDGLYHIEGRQLNALETVSFYADLCERFPIVSIEDGMHEDDWDGWGALTQAIGDRVQLVGDDLFVTNVRRLKQGIDAGVANSILIKMNQIGTLSETLETIGLAEAEGYSCIISHRSGESEDTTLADLAVATNAGQVKAGSASRTDRVAKYNQLLRIEEDLDEAAEFAGSAVYGLGQEG
jgi:enolase